MRIVLPEKPSELARKHPAAALGLIGWCITLLILPFPPSYSVSDSISRIREAHWIWSGENPGGILPGQGGVQHHWFGLGQILLFIGPDWMISKLGHGLPRFDLLLVLVFPIINGVVLALGYVAGRELGLDRRTSILSVLVWSLTTTILWHFQNNQENPHMLALGLACVIGSLRWVRTGSTGWLHLAGAASAWNILIRIPNAAIAVPLLFLPWAARWMSGEISFKTGWRDHARLVGMPFLVGAPWFMGAIILDRVWHHHRFGTWTGTYMDEYQRWAATHFTGVPDGFPFSTPFLEGMAGFLFNPSKSIFLYEPWVGVGVIVLLTLWKRVPPATRALMALMIGSLIITMVGLARFSYCDSEPSWGHRFLATPAHLLQLPVLGLVLAVCNSVMLRRCLMGVCGALFVISVSSLWYPAYHEMIVYRNFGTEATRRPGSDSQPSLMIPVASKDFRLIRRPIEVVRDLAAQWSTPELWAAGSPPLRLLIPVKPFRNTNPGVAWVLRVGWWSGFALVMVLVRVSLQSREDRSPCRQS